MIKNLKNNKDLWNLFTKKEEYNQKILDRHQKFPYYFSTHKNVFDPIVSKFLIKNNLKINYPDNKRFAICLTHDVDSIYFSKNTCIKNILKYIKKYQFKETLKFSKIILNKKNKKWNPLLNFKKIIELEKKYKAKSTFYFLTSKEGEFGANYNIKDLKDELKYIINNGCEVGLHGSYYAYNNPKMILEEKKELENILCNKVIGYRNHCLRFKTPDTWEFISIAGLKYDTTFGYADMVGFRNGMCHPFEPFNLKTNKKINLLEIPLAIMDSTLFDYMKLNMENAWDVTKLLIDKAEKYHGVLTILWHNTWFLDEFLKNGKQFYERILDYCYKKNAWITSGEEIWKWYENY